MGPDITFRIGLIHQKRGPCAKTFFESNEAIIIGIGPSKMDGAGAEVFGVFNCFPQEKRHSAQIVKAGITAAVLVDHSIFVTERENGGNRCFIFARDANEGAIAQTLQHILKPHKRRRRKRLATASQYGEIIKSAKKTFRATFFVKQTFARGTADFSLDGVFVQITKKFFDAGPQIESVKQIFAAILKFCPIDKRTVGLQGTQFNLPPFPCQPAALEKTEQFRKL